MGNDLRAATRDGIAGALTAAAGWMVAESLGVTVPSALLSLLTATAGFAGLMWIFDRDGLKEAVGMVRKGAGEARRGIRAA